mmetsp:Transcript_64842/g.182990  ORF Transcript_64842/g.182990 Transcript_64842/m.182990 type:complete len:319 (-) Transcript_64842:101-1057(-)
MEWTWSQGHRHSLILRTGASSLPSSPASRGGGGGGGRGLGTSSSEPTLRSRASALPSTAFEARSGRTKCFEARSELSARGIKYLHELREDTNKLHNGCKGAAGFRRYLRGHFGSIGAGWRALDEEQVGKLTFNEFCMACRRIGFHGNLKSLWSELDARGVGSISLAELEPRASVVVGSFRGAMLKRHGTMHTAWSKEVDLFGNLEVHELEVVKAVEGLGLPSDIDGHAVFRELSRWPPCLGTLKLGDFDEAAVVGARTATRYGPGGRWGGGAAHGPAASAASAATAVTAAAVEEPQRPRSRRCAGCAAGAASACSCGS